MAEIISHSKMLIKRICVLLSLFYMCSGQVSDSDIDKLLNPDIDWCKDTVTNCYCTNSVIDCDGASFEDIQVISKYLTNTTSRVSLTNGQIKKLMTDSFYNGGLEQYPNVKFLNLSGNPIESIEDGVFKAFPNLHTLDVSDNEGQDGIDSTELATAVSTLNKLENLNLRGIFRSNLGDQSLLFATMVVPSLKSLDLSHNFLIPRDEEMKNFLCGLIDLTTLNLSNNEFTILPFSECMTNIQTIDLSYNKLRYLSADDMDVLESLVNLKSLKLVGNPWSCTCYMDQTLPWLQSTTVPLDFDDIRCITSDNATLIGQRVRDVNFTYMCGEPEIVICGGFGPRVAVARSTFLGIVVGGVVLVVGAVIAVILVCRRRRLKRRPTDETASHMIPDYPKTPAYDRMA